jgi:putative transposase
MRQSTETLAEQIGVVAACQTLSVPRSTLYGARQPKLLPQASTVQPVRALSPTEKTEVRQVLNSERFVDCAPRQVFATLLDEGRYLCSWRTMYRILAENDEVRERRDQLRHPAYTKPELLATGPNQVWSWDITKLLGPVKWTYYYLYVLLDIFSRFVVGWLIAAHESAQLAQELIAASCEKQAIGPNQLTIHADRGGAMTAKTLAMLLADLGVTNSHSRPHVSNDNPFSEAQFKTMKYRPDYPARFGSQVDARTWAQSFFPWYNFEHYHTALGLLTPADVHYGRAEAIIGARQAVLQQAYERHPSRFVKGVSIHPPLPNAVWINPPKPVEGPAAVVVAVDAVGNSERSGELSIGYAHLAQVHSPQPRKE